MYQSREGAVKECQALIQVWKSCSPLTFRFIAAKHKNKTGPKWTTSYGWKRHKASTLTWPEGRRRWTERERGGITGKGALCLAGEAWDGEWQENTETVGRAVGRSQLSLCVCKWPLSQDIPPQGPGRGTDGFSILGLTQYLFVGHPSFFCNTRGP